MADLSGAPELSLACPGPRLRSGTRQEEGGSELRRGPAGAPFGRNAARRGSRAAW